MPIGVNRKENQKEKAKTQRAKEKRQKEKVTLEEKDHTPTQQVMDRQSPRNQSLKQIRQSTTIDRTYTHPKTKAGEKTNQNGMKLIGQGLHGTKVVSPHASSHHLPQTAATYRGAIHHSS